MSGGGGQEGKEIEEREKRHPVRQCVIWIIRWTLSISQNIREKGFNAWGVRKHTQCSWLPRQRALKKTCVEVRWRLNSRVLMIKEVGWVWKQHHAPLCFVHVTSCQGLNHIKSHFHNKHGKTADFISTCCLLHHTTESMWRLIVLFFCFPCGWGVCGP